MNIRITSCSVFLSFYFSSVYYKQVKISVSWPKVLIISIRMFHFFCFGQRFWANQYTWGGFTFYCNFMNQYHHSSSSLSSSISLFTSCTPFYDKNDKKAKWFIKISSIFAFSVFIQLQQNSIVMQHLKWTYYICCNNLY